MSESKRKIFTGAQKAKVALEAVKGTKTINEIAQEHGVHPTQVSQWKKELLDNAGSLFEGKRGPKSVNAQNDPDRLYAKIGQLNMELDWLKKKSGDQPVEARQTWIRPDDELPLSRQCALLKVTRSVVYEQKKRLLKAVDEEECLLLRLLDEEYTRHPFYGSRRMTKYLHGCGYAVNRKRVQRLMQTLGLAGMAPGPNTSKSHPQHKTYPYLLRGVDIIRPNQVWSTDITYIRLPRGFVYLVAIIDWYSRKVLAWRLSNTLDAGFCVDCLDEAIKAYGAPEIFNSDQGSQFTSDAFTGVLIEHGITISMDGRGRALDNIFVERLWRTVKYEEVYLKQHGSLQDLLMGLTRYFMFYNEERLHQSLGYETPEVVYRTATGGGAKIVDKFNEVQEASALV
ncbi:IS3 family transposase [Methylomonas sp. UP202]|uniref:IS3 family transposase n=1 Tax=Methylomonas sp. UP202 TaxID=3040943 RepID=UPI00247A375F|nr:IS3 family transposase [Methylomonas sp. UP202]WGS84013.1 IS3 family transposase [Methylomonas sp. UP202]WGS84083.1 IS3 family transposase [Methylomonas sp. UP202]WGS84864.1 IS3 family transposase [Methylomonas sp. UP202]